MKKLISCMCGFLLLINSIFIEVFADFNLTDDELENVFLTSYKRFNSLHYHEMYSSDSDIFDICIKPNGGETMLVKEINVMGEEHIYKATYEYQYLSNDSFSFRNIEDVSAYLSQSFANSLVEKLFIMEKITDCLTGEEYTINIFEEDENGKLIMCGHPVKMAIGFRYTNFKVLKTENNTAVASITLWHRVAEMPYTTYNTLSGTGVYYKAEPGFIPSTETVEFTKTADGWRISGGTAFEVMLGEREATPNTGDTTATTAALLATIALAAVITPFALSKKRRAR